MLGEEKLIAASRELSGDNQVSQVAVVLPFGAIGKQVAGAAIGGLLGSTDGWQGADVGTSIGEFGTRLGQNLTEEFPSYVLALSPSHLYLLGLHNQGILHRTGGIKLVHAWERSAISITDRQVGISHHVTISTSDGASLTLEGKMTNTGLPDLLKTLGSTHE